MCAQEGYIETIIMKYKFRNLTQNINTVPVLDWLFPQWFKDLHLIITNTTHEQAQFNNVQIIPINT